MSRDYFALNRSGLELGLLDVASIVQKCDQ